MHISATVIETHSGPVPSLDAVVSGVHRHVEILYAMDEEPKGEPSILFQLGWVLERGSKLVDLVHNASPGRDVAGELRIVSGLVQGDVDVVPGSRFGQIPAVLVRP
jgi:hypothetical protein